MTTLHVWYDLHSYDNKIMSCQVYKTTTILDILHMHNSALNHKEILCKQYLYSKIVFQHELWCVW